nr:immunoglobulin light chain junction region [Macaca mulatta]MOX13937.1 immunoglobulin light chain junction region [Macaca mulatta]MOX14443.1 immunoglobulin light chain junction region [Macaca mulatta]
DYYCLSYDNSLTAHIF